MPPRSRHFCNRCGKMVRAEDIDDRLGHTYNYLLPDGKRRFGYHCRGPVEPFRTVEVPIFDTDTICTDPELHRGKAETEEWMRLPDVVREFALDCARKSLRLIACEVRHGGMSYRLVHRRTRAGTLPMFARTSDVPADGDLTVVTMVSHTPYSSTPVIDTQIKACA